jgi:hypothetical protein
MITQAAHAALDTKSAILMLDVRASFTMALSSLLVRPLYRPMRTAAPRRAPADAGSAAAVAMRGRARLMADRIRAGSATAGNVQIRTTNKVNQDNGLGIRIFPIRSAPWRNRWRAAKPAHKTSLSNTKE